MKYVTFLEGLVKTLGCPIEGHGILKPGTEDPVMIKIKQDNGQVVEKMLVFPTDALLKENNFETICALHPACEDTIKGQSEVFNLLLRYTKISMIEMSMLVVEELAKLAASKDKKKSNYTKFISKFAGFDENAIADVNRIKDKFKKGETNLADIVSLNMDRNDYVDGMQYQRVLTFNSPVFEIDNNDVFAFGAKLSSKQRKAGVIGLWKYMLLGEAKQFGSNGDAPYFEALCAIIKEFFTRYNEVLKMFKADTKLEPVDLAWLEHLGELPKWRKLVPSLEGNVGVSIKAASRDTNVGFDVNSLREERTSTVADSAPREESRSQEPNNGRVSLLDLGREDRDDRYGRRETTGNPRDTRSYRDDRRYDDRDRDRYDRYDRRYDDRDRYGRYDDRDRDRDYRREDRYTGPSSPAYGTIKPL